IRWRHEGANWHIEARGHMAGGEFVVLRGSLASGSFTPSASGSTRILRQKLMDDGVLRKRQDGKCRFVQDFRFGSPSAAAGVVCGAETNGWTAWKDDRGRTLREVRQNGP
ncbi:MAG: DUF4357 domain-containing protein, partial [Deltaproteobacteria bacterium]|nr:DUF4357 domain-containing protein [Deltaproteobacteria bacterium]